MAGSFTRQWLDAGQSMPLEKLADGADGVDCILHMTWRCEVLQVEQPLTDKGHVGIHFKSNTANAIRGQARCWGYGLHGLLGLGDLHTIR